MVAGSRPALPEAGHQLVCLASSWRSPVSCEAGLLRKRALSVDWPPLHRLGAPMPAFPWIVITYFVFVLFGFYLLYMYEPISTHYLFSRIFNPFI